MTKVQFRKLSPVRTYSGSELSSYRNYKKYLEKDFNKKCGYTNCSQFWFGGKKNFHIDHFKPKSKYPQLETKYDNLVYSCSYVNIAKGNDDFDYLDPCNENYNNHFYRDKDGMIYPEDKSSKAQYMYTKLKLYLKRYSIIYVLEEIRVKMDEIKEIIESIDNSEDKNKLLELQGELANEFLGYLKYLEAEQ